MHSDYIDALNSAVDSGLISKAFARKKAQEIFQLPKEKSVGFLPGGQGSLISWGESYD